MVASGKRWNGKQKTTILEETAAFSPDDNMSLQAERRKGQMKHNQAIKIGERMSVQFIICIST